MKITRTVKSALLALVSMALVTATCSAASNVQFGPSGTDDPTGATGTGNQLNVQMGVSSWQNWFVNQPTDASPGGITNYTVEFDSTNPPPSGDLNGSVKQLQGWDGINGGTYATFVCVDGNFWGGSTIDLTQFQSFEMDFKYDTNSGITPTNSAQVNITVDAGPRASSTGFALTNVGNSGTGHALFDGQWHHLSIPIPSTITGENASKGVGFQAFNNASTKGSWAFWSANLELIARSVPIAPPSLSPFLVKPVTGLNCIATVAGSSGQFDRYEVQTTTDTGYAFIGQPSVTYSWKIKQFPTGTGENFQQHFFIYNGNANGNNAPDFANAQCIFLTVQQSDAGVAQFNFRYKTNEPAGNSMLFNTVAPTLSNSLPTFTTNADNSVTTNAAKNPNFWPIQPVCNLVDSNGAVGTWSVTFANNTNVTITSPTGLTTNFVFDPASAALFADPVSLAVGAQPNNPNGDGKAVVYANFSVTGNAGTHINDEFDTDTALNTNIWMNISADTNGCLIVPPGSAFWLSWSLPDAGFALLTSTNLSGSNHWKNASPASIILNNGNHQALFASNSLPPGNADFFALVKRPFSQLQVLLPGETAAPGTPTGKTGTPTAVNQGDNVTVTVNAVDSQFNLIPGITDTIQISSSDSGAALPGSANLVNGSQQFTIEFFTSGTNTVTATDLVPTSTVPPGTSSGIVVN